MLRAKGIYKKGEVEICESLPKRIEQDCIEFKNRSHIKW